MAGRMLGTRTACRCASCRRVGRRMGDDRRHAKGQALERGYGMAISPWPATLLRRLTVDHRLTNFRIFPSVVKRPSPGCERGLEFYNEPFDAGPKRVFLRRRRLPVAVAPRGLRIRRHGVRCRFAQCPRGESPTVAPWLWPEVPRAASLELANYVTLYLPIHGLALLPEKSLAFFCHRR